MAYTKRTRASAASRAPDTPPALSTRRRRRERSSRSATPPTAPPCHRLEETSPSSATSLQEANDQIAWLQRRLSQIRTLRRHHRSSRYRRHRSYDSSSSSSSDSEEGEGPRVSFLHHQYDKKPFICLHERYGAVNIKLFKRIFFGTFDPKDLIELAPTSINSDNSDEVSGMVHLLRCFEVYSQAVIHYAAPTVAPRLQEAMSDYRVRLLDFNHYYRFDSIREYHSAFLYTRIISGQDDPIAWRIEDLVCKNLLIRKPINFNGDNALGYTSSQSSIFPSQSSAICRNFNAGRCAYGNCKYSHICSICQQNHAANACHMPQPSINLVPLGF